MGLLGCPGNQGVERVIHPPCRIVGGHDRRSFTIVPGRKFMKRRSIAKSFDVVLEGQVGDAGLGGVGDGTAQFLGGDLRG